MHKKLGIHTFTLLFKHRTSTYNWKFKALLCINNIEMRWRRINNSKPIDSTFFFLRRRGDPAFCSRWVLQMFPNAVASGPLCSAHWWHAFKILTLCLTLNYFCAVLKQFYQKDSNFFLFFFMIYYEGIANEFSDEWSKIFIKMFCITTSMANWKDWINPHLKRIPEIIEKKCCPVPIEKSREKKILSRSHSPFLLIYNT